MLTRDIDWFACIDGKWVHAASVGGILPVAINDCSMLRVMQYVVANMEPVFQIEDLWINESYIDQRYRRHIDDYRENEISENDFRQNYEKILTETNPLKYDVSQASPFYGYKIKHLLTSTALGMMPATAWNGQFDANGGYLVVKKDGEILCYHFYDRNRFEDYLFRSSTSRHEYASIIKEEDGTLSFKLNFQVRLK